MDNSSPQIADPVTPVSFTETGTSKRNVMFLAACVVAIIIGVVLGYGAATMSPSKASTSGSLADDETGTKNQAIALKPEDTRDSATGVIKPKPDKDKKIQGSHILQRDDSPFPVYLLSGVVDLSKYENKKVKVSGFTFGCGANLWCLEVNKVD